jgi:hypothetical protein
MLSKKEEGEGIRWDWKGADPLFMSVYLLYFSLSSL